VLLCLTIKTEYLTTQMKKPNSRRRYSTVLFLLDDVWPTGQILHVDNAANS
jgi:hypothetical protein